MNRHVSMMKLVEDYVSFKRSLGYQIRTEAQMLVGFAKFADGTGHRGPLTTDLMLQWAQLPTRAARLYRARRLEVVRCFAKHRKLFDLRTEIPNRLMLGRAHARRRARISGLNVSPTLWSASLYMVAISLGAREFFTSSRMVRKIFPERSAWPAVSATCAARFKIPRADW